MPAKKKQQQKKNKNQRSGPKTPATPVSAKDEHSQSADKAGSSETRSQPASPYLTPPTSPSTPTLTLPGPSMDALATELQKLDLERGEGGLATPTQELDHADAAEGQQEQTPPGEPDEEVHSEEQELTAQTPPSNEVTPEADEQSTNKPGREDEQTHEPVLTDNPPNEETKPQGQKTTTTELEVPAGQTTSPLDNSQNQPPPDSYQENDTGQQESDDGNPELQESQGSDTAVEDSPENDQKDDPASQAQGEEIQKLTEHTEQLEGYDQIQTSESDNQAQDHDLQTAIDEQVESDGDPAANAAYEANREAPLEGEDEEQPWEDDQDYINEEAFDGQNQLDEANDDSAWDDQFDENNEYDTGTQTQDSSQSQNIVGDQEQQGEDSELDGNQQLLGASLQVEGVQEQTSQEGEQPATLGHNVTDGQEPVVGEPELTLPEADGQSGQEQAAGESELASGADQLQPPQEHVAGYVQPKNERDVTEHDHETEDEDEQTTPIVTVIPPADDLHEEADLADEDLASDHHAEEAVEPPVDNYSAQSHAEDTANEQIQPEQEQTHFEEPTASSEIPIDSSADAQIQDDAFMYGEQDTVYEGELEYEPLAVIQEEELEEEADTPREGAMFDISAKDVASADLLAVADLFANMKFAMSAMSSAFERLGKQTEKMAAFGLDAKAAEQLQRIRTSLEAQISRQKLEVENVKAKLQAKVKEAVENRIRAHLQDVIQNSVQNIIEEKVRHELSVQIPDELRQQVMSHKRQILEVKASLHNSEARRYNALQTIPTLNARLRPLLRPLPTPEQSPVPISISRSSSMGHSSLVTPTTAFPQLQLQVPAPTPIRRTGSNSFRSSIPDTVPPSPSPFFPRDMTSLFALNPEETKRLLREYGLSSAASSPAVEHPVRPRGLSIVNEDAAEEEDPDVHARDLNKFMAHIGVPFLMIPAPKEKHSEKAPLSSKSRRKLLTPLIIK